MSAILYKVTVSVPNPPLLIQRTYHMTSSTEAKAVMAYAQSKGLEVEMRYSSHNAVGYACADIDRELALAARHEPMYFGGVPIMPTA